MALRPDRYEFQTDITFFCDTVTERGVIVVHKAGKTGKGPSMDDANSVVTLGGVGSGTVPAGLLLNDVVATDPSLNTAGRIKDQVQVNAKCTLGRKGWWVTNKIAAGASPAAGEPAYLGASGLLTDAYVGDVQTPRVGRFLSEKDSRGYCKVEVNLP